jgi:hypothetical protein
LRQEKLGQSTAQEVGMEKKELLGDEEDLVLKERYTKGLAI